MFSRKEADKSALARGVAAAVRIEVVLVCALAIISACEVSNDIGDQTAALSPAELCPSGYNVIVGTAGDDMLEGTRGNDCIIGLAGDDTIDGGRGDDLIFGGPGNDAIDGGRGDDTIDGGAGCDDIVAKRGRDSVQGGDGDDIIVVSSRVYSVYAGAGDDIVLAPACRRHGRSCRSRRGRGHNCIRSRIDGGDGTDACVGSHCESDVPNRCGLRRYKHRHRGYGHHRRRGRGHHHHGRGRGYGHHHGDACDSGESCHSDFGICVPDDRCDDGTCGAADLSCDGIDDDCDGSVDEDYISEATSCGVGACQSTGSTMCSAGTETDSCVPGVPAPIDSTCNAIDDDCDGVADEDFGAPPSSCGVGACQSTGQLSCVDGGVVDSCVPGIPAPIDSTCNAIDDDCDGINDEDFGERFINCPGGGTALEFCDNGTVVDECPQATRSDVPGSRGRNKKK